MLVHQPLGGWGPRASGAAQRAIESNHEQQPIMKTKLLPAVCLAVVLGATASFAAPLGTAFTYQGRLSDGTNPANGTYDFTFALYDAASSGTQLGSTLGASTVGVSNGLFSVSLDFGSVFDGTARWLVIAVRTNGAPSYSTLSPRQPLSPAPYSIYTPNAGLAASATTATVANSVSAGSVTAAGIASGQVVKSLNSLHDSVTIAAGNNTTLTPSGQTLTLSTPTDWHIGGNLGTTAGTSFIGTTDNQPLEFKVNNNRALRLEPQLDSVNVIGGHSANAAIGGVEGVAIGGGGTVVSPNTVAANFSTIAGGNNNVIEASTLGFNTVGGGGQNAIQFGAYSATIAGGFANTIGTNAWQSTIGGGQGNVVGSNAVLAVIAGGTNNTIQGGAYSAVIVGGTGNLISSNVPFGAIVGGNGNQILGAASAYYAANYSFIGAGQMNVIEPFGYHSSILGGTGNRLQYDVDGAVIAGGLQNLIRTNADYSAIGGGSYNTISNGATYATIPGGYMNMVSQPNAFAAGSHAKANHGGAFVWADSQSADFSSTGTNQFLIRASGYVGINKNNPTTALDVNGTVTATSFVGAGATFNGTVNYLNTTYLNDHDLFLRSDAYHGLGWYGAGKLFTGYNVNGPVLYGADGGALGTTTSGQRMALHWDSAGNVAVDPVNLNTGNLLPGLTFGMGSTAGISSKRSSGGNQFGLDFYTDGNPRLSIDNAGRVGIGTTAPSDAHLDVHGDIRLNDTQLLLRPGTDRNHGLAWYGIGKNFAGVSVDGPVLFGYSGGALGIERNGSEQMILAWNAAGNVGVGIGTNTPQSALQVGGTVRASGMLRVGSETNAASAPALNGGTYDGLILRRVSCVSPATNTIVARTDSCILIRDGTSSGLTLIYDAASRYQSITCMAVDRNGASVNYKNTMTTGSGRLFVFNDSQKIVHYDITFGNIFNNGHTCHVVLDRFDNTATSDNFMVGTITTTYNQ